MTKNYVRVNGKNKTLEVSKAFLKKASVFGSSEYYTLRDATNENPTFEVVIRPSKKKSYNGLTFERMEDYIKQQPDCDKILPVFEKVKDIADAKGAKYPLTKKWFLKKFPEYKESDIQVEGEKKAAEAKTADDKAAEQQAAAEITALEDDNLAEVA